MSCKYYNEENHTCNKCPPDNHGFVDYCVEGPCHDYVSEDPIAEKMEALIAYVRSEKERLTDEETIKLISEIAGLAREAPEFSDLYRKDAFNDLSPWDLYGLILFKICRAPTSIHMRMSIILLMPLLEERIKKALISSN